MRALLLWLLLALPLPALAKAIVADTSVRHIDIDSRFTGADVMIFGAREEAGDVVVVVRGPEKNFVVRRKKRTLGVWANREEYELRGIPDFYAVAGSRKLGDLNADPLFASLQIGQAYLGFPAEAKDFADAFRRIKGAHSLYAPEHEISFMGETLFKTVIRFPEKVPRGAYTAEFYLINAGQLVGMQSIPIQVSKVGLDATIYDMAHHSPTFYGMLSVGMALFAGWVAAWLFRKY